MDTIPTKQDILDAASRIKTYIHRTPVLTSRSINELLKSELYFKCENLQKVGAFKFRGASNAVFNLSEEEAKMGVATHSSGNHAAALSLAARMRGIPAHIVMPRTAPKIKVRAVESFGGKITFCEPNQAARESTLEKIVGETGATFIHPYNNYTVISAQATAALELLETVPDLDIIITPVGGGGLLSGTALAGCYFARNVRIIAAEPAGANDAYRSLKSGSIQPSVNPKTVCDGLLTSLGSLTFPIIRKYVFAIHTAEDPEIIQAMRLIWERMKVIVEPSSSVPLAILINGRLKAAGKKIGIILSGGNVDLEQLPWKVSD
jgi:threonine dehydratase